MTTHDHPDITCTKCSTVVSWRPHCPHCHAYLEFSGEPPWHPEVPVPMTPSELDGVNSSAVIETLPNVPG